MLYDCFPFPPWSFTLREKTSELSDDRLLVPCDCRGSLELLVGPVETNNCVMMWTEFVGFTFSCCRSISAETHNLFCALCFYLFRGNRSMNAAKPSVLTKMMWMPFPVSPPTTVWIINLLLRLLHSLSQRQRTHTAFKTWRRDTRTHVHITADHFSVVFSVFMHSRKFWIKLWSSARAFVPVLLNKTAPITSSSNTWMEVWELTLQHEGV